MVGPLVWPCFLYCNSHTYTDACIIVSDNIYAHDPVRNLLLWEIAYDSIVSVSHEVTVPCVGRILYEKRTGVCALILHSFYTREILSAIRDICVQLTFIPKLLANCSLYSRLSLAFASLPDANDSPRDEFRFRSSVLQPSDDLASNSKDISWLLLNTEPEASTMMSMAPGNSRCTSKDSFSFMVIVLDDINVEAPKTSQIITLGDDTFKLCTIENKYGALPSKNLYSQGQKPLSMRQGELVTSYSYTAVRHIDIEYGNHSATKYIALLMDTGMRLYIQPALSIMFQPLRLLFHALILIAAKNLLLAYTNRGNSNCPNVDANLMLLSSNETFQSPHLLLNSSATNSSPPTGGVKKPESPGDNALQGTNEEAEQRENLSSNLSPEHPSIVFTHGLKNIVKADSSQDAVVPAQGSAIKYELLGHKATKTTSGGEQSYGQEDLAAVRNVFIADNTVEEALHTDDARNIPLSKQSLARAQDSESFRVSDKVHGPTSLFQQPRTAYVYNESLHGYLMSEVCLVPVHSGHGIGLAVQSDHRPSGPFTILAFTHDFEWLIGGFHVGPEWRSLERIERDMLRRAYSIYRSSFREDDGYLPLILAVQTPHEELGSLVLMMVKKDHKEYECELNSLFPSLE